MPPKSTAPTAPTVPALPSLEEAHVATRIASIKRELDIIDDEIEAALEDESVAETDAAKRGAQAPLPTKSIATKRRKAALMSEFAEVQERAERLAAMRAGNWTNPGVHAAQVRLQATLEQLASAERSLPTILDGERAAAIAELEAGKQPSPPAASDAARKRIADLTAEIASVRTELARQQGIEDLYGSRIPNIMNRRDERDRLFALWAACHLMAANVASRILGERLSTVVPPQMNGIFPRHQLEKPPYEFGDLQAIAEEMYAAGIPKAAVQEITRCEPGAGVSLMIHCTEYQSASLPATSGVRANAVTIACKINELLKSSLGVAVSPPLPSSSP